MNGNDNKYKNKYVCIRKESFFKYLKDYNIENVYFENNDKISLYANLSNEILVKEYFCGLIIIKSLKDITSKALINVSDNALYEECNIDKLVINNIFIEGTDGVGKTSTIRGLIEEGIVCFDRNEEICKYMLFDIDEDTRCNAYKNYLEKNSHKIIFLVNSSKEQLEKRINGRKNISEFDKLAFEYNNLYKKTYLAMEKYNIYNKLFMIDCTNLSLETQIDKVKKYIMEVVNE